MTRNLFVREASGIKDFADLLGKRLGVPDFRRPAASRSGSG